MAVFLGRRSLRPFFDEGVISGSVLKFTGGPVREDLRHYGIRLSTFVQSCEHTQHMGGKNCKPGLFDHTARGGRSHPMAAHPKKAKSHP